MGEFGRELVDLIRQGEKLVVGVRERTQRGAPLGLGFGGLGFGGAYALAVLVEKRDDRRDGRSRNLPDPLEVLAVVVGVLLLAGVVGRRGLRRVGVEAC